MGLLEPLLEHNMVVEKADQGPLSGCWDEKWAFVVMFARNCITDTEICFVFLRFVWFPYIHNSREQNKVDANFRELAVTIKNNWPALFLPFEFENTRQSCVKALQRKKAQMNISETLRAEREKKLTLFWAYKSIELAWRQFLWAYHISKPHKYSPQPPLEMNFQAPRVTNCSPSSPCSLLTVCLLISSEGFCLWQKENEKGW